MADGRLPPAVFAAKSGGRGFREARGEGVLQRIMEVDGGGLTGAGCYEGCDGSVTRRTDKKRAERSRMMVQNKFL